MSDTQRDREERQHVIEVLKQMRLDYEDFWEENDTEEIKAFNYAIASIETDLKYDLLYEETSAQADKPTTKKDCNICTHNNEIDGSNCYECVKDMCNNYEPTTKNDVPDINVGKIESTTKDYLGVDYLGVDAISRQAINGYIDYILSHGMGKKKSFDFIKKFVANLPPVTPIRPKGHWISHGKHCENLGVIPSGLGAYEWCSNCDCGIDVREWHRNNYNYCPNCGARMIEPQESEEKE